MEQLFEFSLIEAKAGVMVASGYQKKVKQEEVKS
jgi:hypothetical protein